MVAWGHSAVGASVGVLTYQALGTSQPAFGLVVAGSAGLISHYICDFIPHGHFVKFEELKSKIRPILIFDVFASILIFLGTDAVLNGFSLKWYYILFAMGGALLPDALDVLISLKSILPIPFLNWEYEFHTIKLHWHGAKEKGLPMRIWDLWQLATVIIAFYLISLG